MKNPYSTRPSSSSAGTMIPGMNEIAVNVERSDAKVGNSKPVVGFLYSVSRTASGEYWPLTIGNNVIGRSEDCDIRLNEMTVSARHAVLNIRQMKTTKKLLVSLDVSGTNGGFVNEEEVGLDRVPCKNGDKITIGDNYVLYLVILDANELGLKVSEDFQPAETDAMAEVNVASKVPEGEAMAMDSTTDLYDPSKRVVGGTRTMGLDGNDDDAGFTHML